LQAVAATCASDLSSAFKPHSFAFTMVLPSVKMALTVSMTNSTQALLGIQAKLLLNRGHSEAII
jgi:hypothetical protein